MTHVRASVLAFALLLLGGQALLAESALAAPCDPPVQVIACENTKAGNPPAEWDVSGGGASDIQGFATDISVNQGGTVRFRVDTDSSDYRLDIYRMGYYGGNGARKVTTVQPSASLPQSQPPCEEEAATGLIDCGNWAESASWAVPATAVSGIYFAKLVREDVASGGSHVVFVVRDDDGESELLFQTSDATWQAYNRYGGRSLYTGGPGANPARAYAVSYNRPLTVRGPVAEDSPFNAEYPMVRWLERNGYEVSYTTNVDSDRLGAELLEHETFLSVGHDEYWSGPQRSNVEAARDAGVNLAFFSGNELFWKTRWRNSIAGPSTPYRTLVSYKETHSNAKIDPEPNVWTGTWRDPRFSPPADGGRPENELSGTAFAVNAGTTEIVVPAEDGQMRLWRDTSVASLTTGQIATLGDDTLGYEWDEAPADETRPAGLIHLSSRTVNVSQRLLDYGSTYGAGPVTHHLTLYRAPSDALVFSAGTIQWSWGLDGTHDRGVAAPDSRMQQATVNLLADMGAQPRTLQAGLTAATQSTDDEAPTATIAVPANGADVELDQPMTISGGAADLESEGGGGGVVGAVEVSVDGGETWQAANGRESWTYSWTPEDTGDATVMARAVDDSGNIQAPGDIAEVDVVEGACPCSIWDSSFTGPQDSDKGAIEVGVKFRSDVTGFITGIRFYKTAGNTGTHAGRLWTAAGTPLAVANFSGETATGWQQASFPAPVPINAGTTYIASYHAPNGRYASITGYFSLVGVDNPPLHALANGVDGANGIYKYGSAGGLFTGGPPNSFNSENYLVDVVFEDELLPDTTAPTITSRSPVGGATDISVDLSVSATFDEPMDPATINGTRVELRDPSNNLVSATVSYDVAQRRVTIDPAAPLQLATTYTAKVKGGAGGVTDLAGNPLAATSTWSFTTVPPPPPPPDEGPGGPILVISNTANPFSRYYGEILRAEGLNEFTVTDIANVTPALLGTHDVAILGEGALSPAQATTLGDWVQAGGNLIAMRPDSDLTGLLGLTAAGGTLGNAYLQVNTAASPGTGIVGQTIQYHGTADRYTLSGGAQAVATLYSNATTSTANPAVTLRSVGSSGGQAAAFSYDLARSIVYTRQGNPAWDGQERDGLTPRRSDDLFFGAKAGDAQPDWIDLNKVAIPQADEQQRLLTNLIGEMNLDRKPLPRFWFLPRDEKAAVVMTGDDHAHNGTQGRFEHFKTLDPPGCTVADWECVRATSYVYPDTPITDSKAGQLAADGFEIALHAWTNCKDWDDQEDLEDKYTSQLNAFAAAFPSLPAPTTNRTHCIVWSDWATQPKVELENGIRLDTTYYYWPEGWVQNRPGMFTGSGMPMRFADLDGSMIDVYQATTQMTDESAQTYPFNSDQLLDRALGAEGYYGVFTANIHTDKVVSTEANAIIASAQARGVPVISARQMLTWLDGRNQSSFESIGWAGNKLSFTIDPAEGANGLRAMVPVTSAAGPLNSLVRGATPVETTTQTIKGVEYAFFDAVAGSYTASYEVAPPPGAPTLSATVPASPANANSPKVSGSAAAGSTVRIYSTAGCSGAPLATGSAAALAAGIEAAVADNSTTAFRATATTTAGASPCSAPISYVEDSSAPLTQIDSTPPVLTTATTANFAFSGSDPGGAGVTFQCRVDSTALGAWVACTSPRELTGLAEGAHTLEVRAVDQAGNQDATPASFGWSVDSKAPETQITANPTALSTSPAANFAFSGTDTGGSGIASFQCRVDSTAPGAWIPCTSPRELTGLTNGTHTFEVRAIDVAGNIDSTPASYTWTVDTVAPDTAIDTNPPPLSTSTAANLTFSGSDPGGSGVASFQCRLDSTAPGAWATCSSPRSLSGLAEGVHSFEVRAVDAAGNADGSPAAFSWTVDSIAPTTQIDTNPPALASSTAAGFTFSGADAGGGGVTFQCRLDSTAPGAWTACTSPRNLSSLSEGAHTFEVRAIDAAGNTDQSPAGFSWTVDSKAPQTVIDTSPAAIADSATANFTFHGEDPSGSGVTVLQCRRDSTDPEDWSLCASPRKENSLAQGPHSFEVRAIDAAGNVDATPAAFAWTIDTQAPNAQITAKPPALANSATASFSFSGEDPGGSGIASLQCRLDSTAPGAWAACTSPRELTGLANGAHSFEVRAIDAAGNVDATPASYAWTVDTVTPNTTIDSNPPTLSTSTAASFTFSGTDPGGSGIASFQCRLDSTAPGAWTACTSPRNLSSLGEGAHTFEVRAVDQAGNPDATPSSFNWTIDSTAPNTQIDSSPTNPVSSATANFTFSGTDTGGSGVASFQCRRDSTDPEDWSLCASPRKENSLAEGPHTFEVRAIDVAGNVDSTPAAFTWTIDTVAPVVTIDSGPAGLTNDSTPTFAFSSEPGAGFQCSIDTGTATFGPCSSAGSHTPASPLSPGIPYTFRVRATDGAGNQGTATRAFEVGTEVTQPPELSATAPASPANNNTPAVIGSAPAGSAVRLYATADCTGAPLATGSAAALTAGIPVTVADDSTTALRATATSAGESTSTCSAPLAYTEDSSAPQTQITANPAALVKVATATFSFNGSDPGGSGVTSFQCRRDSTEESAWQACTSPREYVALADGSHKFEVRATDAAGNTDASPATHTWTIDTVAPTVQIDSGPNGLTNDSTPTFAFSSEPGATFECSIDTGTPAFGPCSSAGSHTPASPLADGPRTFRVRATDAVGNQAAVTRAFNVDATTPDTQITSNPAALVKVATATFSFNGSDPGGSGIASFQCRLDSAAPGAWVPCTSPRDLTGLPNGTHTFEVRAIDVAGNTDASPATYTWTVDLTAPQVTVDSLSKTLLKAGETSELTWHADENGSFQLRVGGADCDAGTVIDSGTYGSQPGSKLSNVTAAQLAEGANTLRLCLVDAAGNRGQATTTISRDTGTPETQITANPAALVKVATATFSFNGTDPGGSGVASFECRLDSSAPGAWQSCTSPREYTGLPDGAHSFEVRALDQAGNLDASPASYGWTIDTTAPSVAIDFGPSGVTNDSAPTFAFSSEPGATFECSIDTGTPAFGPCSSAGSHTPASPLADGPRTFRVRATDAAGNQAAVTRSFTVDATAPDTQITLKPAALVNSSTASFTFNGTDPGGSGVALLECRLDSTAPGAWAACTSPREYTSLADGSHTFEVRALDQAGNLDASPASYGWTIDTTAPSVAIDFGPSGVTNDSTPTFAFSSEPGATFECSIDTGTPAFGPCSSAGSHTPASPLADGPRTFRVRATDAAGNQAAVTRSFTVDATAPDTQITLKPAALVNSSTASFTFNGTDPGGSGVALLECRLDSTAPGAWAACTSPREYTSLADGSHTFEVRATDAAGNTDASPASHTWTIDTAAPTVQIDSGPNGLTNDSTPTFAFSSEPGATFECSIDTGTPAFGPCSSAGSHTPASPLADGPRTFRVRATDAAGNPATATRSFTVDTAAPAAPTLSATVPASPANDNTPQIVGSAPAGTTVRLFSTSDCSGVPIGTVSAAALEAGVEAIVADDSTTAFRATATSAAGNTSTCSSPLTYLEDSASPDTQITANPAALVKVATATFSFNGSDPGGSGIASIECRLDSTAPGAWVSCTSPRNLTGLADGSHKFEVRATDQAGNTDASPASHTWTIDTAAPTVQIDSGPNGLTNDSTPTFAFSSEPGATFECSIDTGTPAFGPCSAAGSHTPASPLADGPRTFRVRATDNAGNQATATRSFTVDTAAPAAPTLSATVPASPANDNTPQIVGSAQAGTTVRLFSTSDCSGVPIATVSAAALEAGVEATVADDSTTAFRATATSAAGNTSGCSLPLTYLEDSASPDTQITANPAALVNSSTASFSFNGTDPGGSGIASIECRLDSTAPGAWVSCTSPRNLSDLTNGAHTFEVRAIDVAGNTDASPATYTWTVDLTAPQVQIDSLSKTLLKAGETSELTWHADENGSFQLRVGGADCDAGTVIDSGTYGSQPGSKLSNVTAAQLAEGANTLRLCLVDAAGNRGQATTTISRDTGAPETQITANPAALVKVATATFSFNGTDPGGSGVASFECRLDSSAPGAWQSCTSPREYTSLADGSHKFEVRATDQAGNTDASPASHTWTIDTAAPTVQIDSGPNGLTNDSTPTFAFSSEPGATFECSIDTGTPAFGPCSAAGSHTPASPLADGPRTFRVRVIDNAGNQATATRSFTVDATAPDTQITANPAALVKLATAEFAFNGTDPGGSGIASIECRLDSTAPGAWVSCTSPRNLTGLADGSHTFEVRATDAAGNTDASPATHTWTVDTTAPSVAIDSGPAGLTNDSTPTFAFSSEPGATFECSIDTGTPAFGPCSSAGSHTPASPLADGPRTFRVRATDAAGNPATATRSFTVDTAAPAAPTLSATVPASPANDNTPQIVGSAPAGTTVRLFSTSDCSGVPIATVSAAALEAGVEATVADDSTTSFSATATTAAENTSGCSAPRVYVEDSMTPGTQITANPAALVNSSTASFSFNGTDPGGSGVASFECRLDSTAPGAWVSCTSPRNLSNLPEGSHSFEVRATDQAGNVDPSPAVHTWTVDTTAPQTQIDNHPAALSTSATAGFAFNGTDPGGSGVASFQCRRDAEDWTACSSPRSYAALAEGAHSFEVRAIDSAGNVDATPALFGWTIDTNSPDTQITVSPPVLANSSSATLSFNGTDPGGSGVASLQCRLDSTAPGAWVSCTSPRNLTGLADGSHTFEVRATDAAGNTDASPASHTWTVDTAAPSTQIDSGPPSLSVSAAASFTFSGSDPGGAGVSFQCRLDSSAPGAWVSCTSPRNLSSLADGSHTFEVRATDAAGNTDASPANHTWTIDTTAPTVQIDSGPNGLTNDSTPTFAFSSEPGATFECSIDTGTPAFGPCSVAGSHTPASPLADGPRTFRVRATDNAGNQATATRSFNVDTAAPAAPTLSATVQASPANDNTPQIVGSAQAGTTVRLFSTSDCSGVPIATVSAAALEAGVEATVADDSTTAFRATATSAAGNASGCSLPISYVEDSSAPSTSIDSNPPALGVSPMAGFTFSGADPGGAVASFECRRDAAAWAPCASPKQYSGLSDGAHTFDVRAVDQAGNADATPATFAWTVDATAPDTQITTKPPVLSSGASAGFSFLGDDHGGSGATSFQCRLDSGEASAWQACTSPHQYANLADGPHQFEARAIDAVGNADPTPATYNWAIDTTVEQSEESTPVSPPLTNGPAPDTPDAVRFVRIRNETKSGTAFLVFEVPGPGSLSARAPELTAREAKKGKASAVSIQQLRLWRKSIKPSSVRIAEAGLVEVPIALTPSGKKLLQESRKLKLKVVARFKAADGDSTTWKITVTLKKVDSLASGTRR